MISEGQDCGAREQVLMIGLTGCLSFRAEGGGVRSSSSEPEQVLERYDREVELIMQGCACSCSRQAAPIVRVYPRPGSDQVGGGGARMLAPEWVSKAPVALLLVMWVALGQRGTVSW
jgi:hypothetical protein